MGKHLICFEVWSAFKRFAQTPTVRTSSDARGALGTTPPTTNLFGQRALASTGAFPLSRGDSASGGGTGKKFGAGRLSGSPGSEVLVGKQNLFGPRLRSGLPVESAIHNLTHPQEPPLRVVY
jgi:hypothetical protein